MNPQLLTPSLRDPRSLLAAPYSQQTSAIAAFFGGPFAMASMLALDSKRMGRLSRDWVWSALIAVVFVAWLVFIHKTAAGSDARAMLNLELGSRGLVIVERLIALLGFALGAWLHGKEQRSATLFGLRRPNGVLAGIVMIAVGNVLSYAVNAALE